MTISILARAAGFALLAATLAGCVDIKMEVAVLGDDHARATVTTTMDKAAYDEANKGGDMNFCDASSTLTQDDAKVSCTEIHDGDFASVFKSGSEDGKPQPTITKVSDNTYRVTFPTGTMAADMGSKDQDPQMLTAMKAMFAGHKIILVVSGSQIIDTNMTKSDDGKSASLEVTFDELFDGGKNLPEEAFAVVQAN